MLFIPIVVVLLAITNYTSGTILTGWDNLHPEFYFDANIKRSLFAVWQEYQGLGLLGGMGHASDLLRQLFLSIVSFVLPTSFLRYFWTILALLIGSLGAYFLTAHIVKNGHSNWKLTSLLSALFYVLNLSTVQTYYVIFETFSAHFAALPWLLLATIHALQKQKRKNLVLLLVVLLLATPAAYVPTLFVVTMIALFTVAFFLTPKKPLKSLFLSLGKLAVLVFLINAFWLLPFVYFTLTNSQTNVHAKINQMATEEIFLKNKEFGNITDTMLLRGFWFNNVEPDIEGNYTYMLAPWREHLASPVIAAIGYMFFAVIILGVIVAVRKKDRALTAFAVLFLFAFTMLTTATPPFSWIDILFRKIPLFDQAFRFPFTKFSILASLTYAIFFAIGIQKILSFITDKKILSASSFLVFVFLIVFTIPAFQGHLFYERALLKIPNEYFALFDFFRNQDPNTRIANFPQHTFWGWNFYRWGYSGSGFLWYGIRQPILDRAFDVWSNEDENYYFEIANALYAKNPKLLTNVFEKYQINWLLIDKNVINPPSPQALLAPELEKLLTELPQIKKEASFGNLDVYKVELKNTPRDFVLFTDALPSANKFTWGEQDRAFLDLGNYIATSENADAFYPFRTLFSGKSQNDISFQLEEKENTLELLATVPKEKSQRTLLLPSFASSENIVPADIVVRQNVNNTIGIFAKIKSPQVTLGDEKVSGGEIEEPLFVIPQNSSGPLILNINGAVDILIENTSTSEEKTVETTFFSLKENNLLVLKDLDARIIQTHTIPGSFLTSLPFLSEQIVLISPKETDTTLRVSIPKITDDYVSFILSVGARDIKNCENFRKGTIATQPETMYLKIIARNANACGSFHAEELPHREGYAVFLHAKNEKGRGLHFWVLNETDKNSLLETYLPANKKETLATFIFPPQDPFGKGYTLHMDTISIGQEETINHLGKTSMYPFPYNFITSLVLTETEPHIQTNAYALLVTHPNESLYTVRLPAITRPATLILSQSFDPGWKAYETGNVLIPLFGKEIKNHVLVNNWENGWLLESRDASGEVSIVIVYLPQYLQYFGFGILGITFVGVVFTTLRRKVRS